MPPENKLVASVSEAFTKQRGAAGTARAVPTTTLDAILERAGIDRIDFVSMDIELSEPKALAGFDIERYKPSLICIEAHPEVRQQILDYFVRHGYKRVRVLGSEGVWRPLEAAGITVIQGHEDEPVDAVFVGWYREFRMDDIQAACDAVAAGARLFTGSLAPYFASAHGRVLSSSRVICAAITNITGKRATVLGKPAPEALRFACRRLGIEPAHLVVVGDDPSLEVYMARRGGALGIAVRTGTWGQGPIARLPTQHRPHLALENVGELLALMDGR